MRCRERRAKTPFVLNLSKYVESHAAWGKSFDKLMTNG
jgi:hypothetical protein